MNENTGDRNIVRSRKDGAAVYGASETVYMKILAIETSCDETAVAILEASGDFQKDFKYKILGNALLSQASLHAKYGGVFPNLAKREHGRNLVPLLMEALRQAGMLASGNSEDAVIKGLEPLLAREKELYGFMAEFLRTHGKPDVDCIAVTYGPGLEPALWVGINFAKALSRAWNVPIVAVNHMEGHILMSLAHTLPSPNPDTSPKSKVSGFEKLEFPALALLVSGGHTELVLIEAPPLPLDSASELQMKYRIVGETRDDAAGEAFDKCARLLGLPYPGGPEISRLATHARTAGRTKPHLILPRPMLKDGLEFSFSGLKTAVLRAVEGKALSYDETTAMAREIEDAIVEVLVTKTERAAEEFGAKTIIMSGGVSANEHLRAELTRRIPEVLPLGSILFPAPEFATDNAVMIALAGYFHAQRKEFADPTTLEANGNLRLA